MVSGQETSSNSQTTQSRSAITEQSGIVKTKIAAILGLTLAIQAYGGSATWNSNPISSDWNTSANWAPATVPNGPDDTATFSTSDITGITISAGVELNSIVFEPGADLFTVKNAPGQLLTMSGAGVTNSSGAIQNFVNQTKPGLSAQLYFTNGATAGDSVVYSNMAGTGSTAGAHIWFLDNSTAGTCTFLNTGSAGGYVTQISFHGLASAGQAVFTNQTAASGEISFWDSSTADHATLTNEPGLYSNIFFYQSSTAGTATIINHGGGMDTYPTTTFYDTSTAGDSFITVDGSLFYDFGNAWLLFNGDSSAGHATVTANGGQVPDALGGQVYLQDNATADNATFIANGGLVEGSFGGRVTFQGYGTVPTAANAILIATGGVGGAGAIVFEGTSAGGEARVELYQTGFLDLRLSSPFEITIGSLEGNGMVFLNGESLIVGSNNLSTRFSGLIDGVAGRLTKVGTGSFTLSGANTYTGGTTIEEGKLVINNKTDSGTGSGPVQVNGGRLAGRGIIAGNVTVGAGSGPGALLAPGQTKGSQNTLTIQGQLTFHSDGIYECGLNSKRGISDKIAANGVTIDGGQFTLRDPRGFTLTSGTILTVIDNTSANSITGTFSNLPDGGSITVGANTFQANYEGGDGNDLTLTVVP